MHNGKERRRYGAWNYRRLIAIHSWQKISLEFFTKFATNPAFYFLKSCQNLQTISPQENEIESARAVFKNVASIAAWSLELHSNWTKEWKEIERRRRAHSHVFRLQKDATSQRSLLKQKQLDTKRINCAQATDQLDHSEPPDAVRYCWISERE